MTLYEANITAGHPEPSALDLLDKLLDFRNVQIDAADYAEIQDILDDEVRRKREAEGVGRRVDTSEQKNRAYATSWEDQTIAKTIEGTIAESDGHDTSTMVQAGIVEWPNEAVMTVVGAIAPSRVKVDLLEDLTSNERTINDQAAIADEVAVVTQAHVPECADGQRVETAPVDVRVIKSSKTTNKDVVRSVDHRLVMNIGEENVDHARDPPPPSPAKRKRKRTSLGSIANEATYHDSKQAEFERLLTLTNLKRLRYEDLAQYEEHRTAFGEERTHETTNAVDTEHSDDTHEEAHAHEGLSIAHSADVHEQAGPLISFQHPCPIPGCDDFLDEVLETTIGAHMVNVHKYGIIREVKGVDKLFCSLSHEDPGHTSISFSMTTNPGNLHKAIGRHILTHHAVWGQDAYACRGPSCSNKFNRSDHRNSCRASHQQLDEAGRRDLANIDKRIRKAAIVPSELRLEGKCRKAARSKVAASD